MQNLLVVTKSVFITACVLFVVACAQQPQVAQKESIRVCDANGCADRPHDYATFQPQPDEADRQMAALEAIAVQDPRAAYDLALRFFRGDGVRQDTYQSIKWMRVAAEKGLLPAQMALGRVYLTGLQEMGSDPGEAEKWLSITVNRGDTEAGPLLQQAIMARQSVQAQYKINNQWRSNFYNNWYSGYRYQWYWQNGGWSLY